MSIENITLNILNEAKSAADISIKNAEERSLEIINEAKLQAETITKEYAERTKNEAEILKNRKVSAAELQSRKMKLSAKQDAIKKSFEKALLKLKEMPEEKYIDFLSEEIVKIPNCEGVIILNENDREKIGEELVKKANEKLKDEKLSLSKKTIHASGGFILKNGSIEINSTFETLLDSIKDELTYEVASILFK